MFRRVRATEKKLIEKDRELERFIETPHTELKRPGSDEPEVSGDLFLRREAFDEKVTLSLLKIPPESPEAYLKEPPLSFTDMGRFFQGGMHGLVVGITGSGKTTLLLSLLDAFLDRGYTILARDDGGLESLNLLYKVPMRIWIPEGCELKMKTEHKHDIANFDWKEPGEILDRVNEYPFNLVVFDAFCIDPGTSALFYSTLFRSLIFKCMQTPPAKKKKLIFSVDELNDLIQPKGFELSSQHSSVRSLIEYNIRKLRKHKVTLLATTHRFTQLGISVRSQFSYIFMKQSYGWDAWDFISKSLATQNNKVFWATLKDISTFDRRFFYLFDYKNNFDKFNFNDIHREEIEYEMTGAVSDEKTDRSSASLLREDQVMYFAGKGYTYDMIAEEAKCTESQARQIVYNARKRGFKKLEVARKKSVCLLPQEA